jgi:hypothetical protein
MRDPSRTEQTCTKCGETKPIDVFDKNREGKNGPVLHTACRTCRSAAAYQWWLNNKERAQANKRRLELRKRYGITPEMYDQILAQQGGGCAVCGAARDGDELPVDHDHVTGAVRGILCHRCNLAIGSLGDDIDLLKKAIYYLQRGVD